jgi:hypothetical protein
LVYVAEVLKIDNTGELPVGVTFKTTFPFAIVLHPHQDPVEEWTYELAPKELLRFTLNFDGRHLRKDRGNVFFDSELAVNINNRSTVKELF